MPNTHGLVFKTIDPSCFDVSDDEDSKVKRASKKKQSAVTSILVDDSLRFNLAQKTVESGANRELFLPMAGVPYECAPTDDDRRNLFVHPAYKGKGLSATEFWREQEKEKEKDRMRSQVKRASADTYVYNTGPQALQPLTAFYPHLVAKGRRLKMLMADTLIGIGPSCSWMYTSAAGEVRLHKDFTVEQVMARFGNPADDSSPVAVVKKPSYKTANSNDISIVDTRTLYNILTSSNDSSVGVVQQYIKSTGSKPWFVRTLWRRRRNSMCWMMVNKKRFGDPSLPTVETQYATSTATLDSVVLQVQGSDQTETTAICDTLIEFLERTVQPKVEFANLVADFIKDSWGRWWFLQVKAFELVPNK